MKKAIFNLTFRAAKLTCLFALLVGFLPAHAQDTNCAHDYMCEKEPKRIALVIGNTNYANLERLPSAATDAEQMKQRLEDLGFEVVLHNDVQTPFKFWQEIVPAFRQKLSTGDFIVFYFSGHGFSYGADSFLAPTELPLLMTVQHVTDHAIAVESFKSTLETHSPGLILFILDACRSVGALQIKAKDDPKAENLVAKGPADMERRDTAINTMIAFATRPGHIALGSSQEGQLSPFTEALVGNLTTEGKSFSIVFRKAAAELEAATTPPQVAGTFDWSRTDPYLKPTDQNRQDAKEAWLSALTSGTPKGVRVFLQLNSVSRHVIAAKKWIADHPADELSKGFTRVSPIAIDRAWHTSLDEMVAVRRLSVPLAFSRSVSENEKPILRELSDADVGLVRSGIKSSELATLTTGSEFLATIAPDETVHADFFRNSLAYSLANLDAHGTVVATEPLIGRSQPQSNAKITERISPNALLQIRSVLLTEGNNVWVQAESGEDSTPFYFKVDPRPTADVLELGHSTKEILVPPRPNSLPELVDPAPIKAAIAELKAQGWRITWVSLSTAPAADEIEQETRAARMANAEYILKQSDLPVIVSKGKRADIGERITSVAGRAGFDGDAVRIRFFGIK
jgi:hypothetical protein